MLLLAALFSFAACKERKETPGSKNYQVDIKSFAGQDSKLAIQAIREITGFTGERAADRLTHMPTTLHKHLTRAEAEDSARKLRSIGFQADVVKSTQ
jgi:ribosomal protein L7/L12